MYRNHRGPFTGNEEYWTFDENGCIVSVLNNLSVQIDNLSGQTSVLKLSEPSNNDNWKFVLEAANDIDAVKIDFTENSAPCGDEDSNSIDMICRLKHNGTESYLVMNNNRDLGLTTQVDGFLKSKDMTDLSILRIKGPSMSKLTIQSAITEQYLIANTVNVHYGKRPTPSRASESFEGHWSMCKEPGDENTFR